MLTHQQKLPPLVLNFFVDFLKVWNGIDGRDAILRLMPYAPLLEFESMAAMHLPCVCLKSNAA